MTDEHASSGPGATPPEPDAGAPRAARHLGVRLRRKECRVTLIGRPMTGEAWADVLRECLDALTGRS